MTKPPIFCLIERKHLDELVLLAVLAVSSRGLDDEAEEAIHAANTALDMPVSDLEKLFMKYMAYVGDAEGTDFTQGTRSERFTDEEWTRLQKIAEGSRRDGL